LDISALAVLASLPSLKYLDITRNEISRFPSVIKTMHKWKDFVIERLIPTQVAAMEASLAATETKKENTALLSQDVQPSRRSFKSTVTISRSRSRLSLTDDQKEEIRRSDSRISSVAKRLSFGFTPKTGFPELQTLILEGNNISSSDIFDTLGSLPNLVNLNMNHNMIMALNALIPNNYNGAADVLNDNPKNITKYDGFFKLEELSLKFNRIPQLENLVGLLCLPKIKNVYLEGNSVLKYCCHSKTKAKGNCNLFINHRG
jgi:Leucine-rich repeat (LRR) protein